MQLIPYLIIILSGLAGIVLTLYIRNKKASHTRMICPLGADCDAVIHSEYASFFGIPVELLGLLYYAIIVVSYVVLLALPQLALASVMFMILLLSATAFLFSLYLTFIQAFSLKQWCTWCLASAGLCTIIFGFALFASKFGFITLLDEHRTFILIIHTIGFAIGLGGATISDIFFFRFLKDLRISHEESSILASLSQIIWFSLAVIIISGIGLYLPQTEVLNASAKFLVKMLVVGVIIINGAFLNLLIAPKLVKISFGKTHRHEVGELHHERKLAFAFGAISLTSWYSAFVLGMMREISLNFFPLFLLYLLLLAVAIGISQFVERSVSERSV